MADPDHLALLEKGVVAWNRWRYDHPDIEPDLSKTNLSRGNFSWTDLGRAKLAKSDLSRANLTSANLKRADLSSANLSSANLTAAELIEAYLSCARFMGADLRWAKLIRAKLTVADLRGADLSGAELNEADLGGADLRGADLRGADLIDAHLRGADLRGADLSGADLNGAELIDANLSETNLSKANVRGVLLTRTNFDTCITGGTNFCDNDLSEATGMDNINHRSPSSIGIDTLYKSNGRIPEKFLRDAGVPEEIIDITRSIRCGPPIQWHSCFISYSTQDEEFARRLHSRMREANLRVWFAPEDLAGGKKLHEQLFEAIQLQDKLLLVLSDASIQSEWVMTEIRKARQIEKKEKRRKLFPIRLVGFDALGAWTRFDGDTGNDLAVEVREYFIPDFSNWKNHDAFESAFKRLLKDLKADAE